MSAYITLMTPMTDQECLLAALADVGFVHSKVEVHDSPVPLVGYEGASRAQTAHLVIRRQNVGSASNDLGFLATPTGFQSIVSDYDQQRYGASWLAQVSERYRAHSAAKMERLAVEERQRMEEERKRLVEAQRVAVHEKAKKLGYQIKESRQGETVRLVLIKRTY